MRVAAFTLAASVAVSSSLSARASAEPAANGARSATLVQCTIGRLRGEPAPAARVARRFLVAFPSDFEGLSGKVRLDTPSGYVTVPFEGNASYHGIMFARVTAPDDVVAATFERASPRLPQACRVHAVEIGTAAERAPTVDASAFVAARPACAAPFAEPAVLQAHEPAIPPLAVQAGVLPRTVHATVWLDASGAVIETSSFGGMFESATMAALRRSTYAPAVAHCVPYASILETAVQFDAPPASR